MRNPEEELISILKDTGIDLLCTLPCDRIKNLIVMAAASLRHLPLTREEEGVGICAGAALAGKRAAMLIQNSGMGNMINALLSLTAFYRLPLPVFVSHRGIYREKIRAQRPMGRKLAGILKGAGIPCTLIDDQRDLPVLKKKLGDVFRKSALHVFLLSPALWEQSCPVVPPQPSQGHLCACRAEARQREQGLAGIPSPEPGLTRYEIFRIVAPLIKGSAVVCNLGFPARELYSLVDRPSHFYMLGSMGMVTPIALGIALSSSKRVVALDGDGSLLMNPGSLATAALVSPANLTIVAVDNGAYGSTGNQPTCTTSCVDLEAVARGFGMRDTFTVSDRKGIISALAKKTSGPRFIRVLAVAGNRNVPIIPLTELDIRDRFQRFLGEPRRRPSLR